MDAIQLRRDETWLRPRARQAEDCVMVLAYPNTYSVGMSSLGFQTIRQLADETPGWSCARLFMEEVGDGRRRRGRQLLVLDLGADPTSADLIAFSVSYELDFVNVLRCLSTLGLPLRPEDRDDDAPLVGLGGVCTSINIEPLANFVDLVFVGEGEPCLPEALAIMRDTRGQPRASRLAALADVKGIYVPSLHDADTQLVRAVVDDLATVDTASTILTPHTEFADMRLVEVSRGCARGCSFCIVPTCLRPVRFRPADDILRLARPARRVGLLGAAASDHPEIERVICALAEQGLELSISASRSEPLSERSLRALTSAGQRTLTLAPEAGSESARLAVGKRMPTEDVLRTAKSAGAAGFCQLKLYYMIGLPGAGDEEVEDLFALTEEVCRAARPARVCVSVNPFVPKPGTPLQWVGMEAAPVLKARAQAISKRGPKLRGGPRFTCEGPRWPVIEALLARGDRRLGPVLQQVAASPGQPSDYKRALRDADLKLEWYVHRTRPLSEPFAWDALTGREERDRLARAYQRLREAWHG